MKDGYKEIKIKHSFSEDEQLENQEPIEVELEDVTEGLPVETEVEAPKVESKPAPQEDKRKERAKARIKQLLAREREQEERYARLENELRTEREKNSASNKETHTAMKSRIEASIAMLQKQMTDAIKNGDAEAVVVYQDELVNAKMELAEVNTALRSIPEPVQTESPANRAPAPQVPEKAQDWIADHPEFYTDPVFQNMVLVVNNQLIREGYKATSDEFYEELDERVGKRFPEYFGIEAPNSVDLKQAKKADSSKSEQEDVKPTQKVRITEQTVSGSSRPTANSSISRKVTSVELSPEDIAQAERWGLTLEQMARRIAHSQKNKRPDGYVQIAMTKE